MKNSYIYLSTLVIVFTLVFSSTAHAQSECDSKALKEELYQMLKPNYRYDKSKVSTITVKNSLQGGEIGVPILNTESYRLLFNIAGFPADINIKVYDKPMGSENRTLLYSIDEEKKQGKTTFLFKPPAFEVFRIIYIDYIVPAATDKKLVGQEGCVIFLMGYKVG